MDCIHLKLSNKTVDFDIKHDVIKIRTWNRLEIINKETGRCSFAMKATKATIKEFQRRIDEARKDRTIDCTGLHGKML